MLQLTKNVEGCGVWTLVILVRYIFQFCFKGLTYLMNSKVSTPRKQTDQSFLIWPSLTQFHTKNNNKYIKINFHFLLFVLYIILGYNSTTYRTFTNTWILFFYWYYLKNIGALKTLLINNNTLLSLRVEFYGVCSL